MEDSSAINLLFMDLHTAFSGGNIGLLKDIIKIGSPLKIDGESYDVQGFAAKATSRLDVFQNCDWDYVQIGSMPGVKKYLGYMDAVNIPGMVAVTVAATADVDILSDGNEKARFTSIIMKIENLHV